MTLDVQPAVPATPTVSSSNGGTSTSFGVSVTLTCTVSPSTGLTYSWKKDGSVLSGEASSTLVINADATTDSGSYVCVVTDSDPSSTDSAGFALTVLATPAAPTITHAQVVDGDSVTLTCVTSSSGTFTYEFFANSVSQGAASSSTSLSLGTVTFGNESITYTCTAINGADTSPASAGFQLTVVPQTPSITSSPSGDVTDASSFTLTCVTASTGLSTETYVWNIGGTDQSSQSSNTLTQTAGINNVQAYSCKVSGDGGTDYSAVSTTFTPSVKAQTPTVSGTSSLTDGDTTTLTCSSASSPLSGASYEWYADGIAVSGASSSTYTTPVVSMSDDGKVYTCKVVFNAVTSDISSTSVTLTVVPQTPSITSSPSGDVTDASSFTLTCVTASTGLSTETYVWNIGGTDQSSQSSNTLTQTAGINNVQAYSCKVSGDGGTDYSAVSTTFTPSVKAQTPTVSGTSSLTDGDTTTLTCSSASSPLSGASYEWYADEIAVNGASSSTYTTPVVSMSDNGKVYTCKVVFNAVTSDISSTSVTLTVVPQTPSITSSPSGDVTDASSFTLTCVTASTGLSTETYVWNIGGTDQSSQSSNTLTQTADINNVQAYSCKVSGDGGTDYSAVSTTFTPSVKAQTPTVSGTSSLTDGDTTTLTCSSASSPLSGASYEWYANGIAVSGASSSAYTTPVVSMSDDGKVYTCKVVFNAVTSDISSTSVTLTVVPQTPSITSSPSGDVTDASSFTLTCVTASTGLSTETYVWNIGGTDQSSQSSNTLTQTADINNVQAYSCKVSGDGGTDYSAVSTTFTPSVKAQTPTVSGTSSLTDGDTTTLTCSSASSPLSGASYEWYANGIAVSGASSSTYTTPVVSMSDDGKVYTCKVVFNVVTSDISSTSVTLTVVPQTPSITSSPSGDVTDASSFTLTCVTASTGLSTETYVWNIGGTDQSSQSSNTLTQTAGINNVQAYSCKVSGDGGTDYSAVSTTFTPSVKAQTPTVSGTSSLTDGDTTTLTCSSASSPLSGASYEWYANGIAVSGASSSTYTTPVVSMSDDGKVYTCKVVFNAVTSDISSTSVTLTVVPQTPSITSSPSGDVTDASSFTLTCVTASTGLSTETYVWNIGGTDQSSQSSNTLTQTAGINNVQAYSCKVSGDGGTDYSAVSTTFTPSVKAQTPTVSGTSSLTDGDTTTLTCSSASSPLSGASYEWYANGIAVSGASSSTYTTPVVSMSDDGKVYTCKVVFNAVTSDISSTSVTLTVVPQTPSITSSPSGDVTDASSFTLTCVTASTGLSTETYVWNIGGTDQSSQSSNTLTQTADINNVQAYSCKVSGDGGTDYSVVSTTFTPSVKAQTPTVSGTSSLTDGDTTTLTCSSASSPLSGASYEWYADGIAVSGASSSTYTTPVVSMSDDGKVYTCKVVFNAVTSDISSTSVTLTVVPQTPSITSSPSGDVTDASSFTLTCVTASTGLSTETYVWNIGGTDQSSQSSNTLTQTAGINNVQAYSCKVSGDGGTDYSAVSTTFTPSVKAQTPTVSGTSSLTDGDTTTLTCSSASSPLSGASYEWNANGIAVSGASSSTYTTPVVSMSDDGKVYTCKVVFNAVTSDISSTSVTLTVVPQTPSITSSPSGDVTDASSFTLTCVTASTGLSTETYVWNIGGTDQSSQSSNTLTQTAGINNVQAYSCKVSGDGGTDYSAVSTTFTPSVKAQTPTVSGTSSLTDGDTTTLTCSSASSPLSGASYEWYANGIAVSGASSSTYTTPVVSMSDDGKVYTCKVVFNAVTSDISSTSVTLTVVPQTPSITSSPSGDVTDASSFTLTCVTASTGLSTETYVWNIGGTDQSSQSSNTLTQTAGINNVQAYSCKVSGDGGTDYSAVSTTFTPSVKAQTPTVSGTSSLTDGDTTTLTCSSASSPLSGASYEWYANGIAVSGASSSTYTTPVFSMSDDGKVYTCKVVFNAVTSDISSTSVTLTGEYEWLVLLYPKRPASPAVHRVM
ncbi:serine-rich adhesin for platelets-like [Littorina saxatilis]|uniref:serine-rich adhesin for platelets-like n=1 Tax=Littorina saxatilis TaxID=31220 RepID=UPI0038B49BA1